MYRVHMVSADASPVLLERLLNQAEERGESVQVLAVRDVLCVICHKSRGCTTQTPSVDWSQA